MAKKPYRAMPAHYYFKLVQSGHVELAKMDPDNSGPALVTYNLKGGIQDGGRILCDCPGAYRGYEGDDHKHVQWIRRWWKLVSQNPSRILMYDSKEDAFYEVMEDGFNALKELL